VTQEVEKPQYTRNPFLQLADPVVTKDGQVEYEYVLEAISNPRTGKSKFGAQIYIDVKLISTNNPNPTCRDAGEVKFAATGKDYTISAAIREPGEGARNLLERALTELNVVQGMKFKVLNKGKPKGKRYRVYKVEKL
jgi:hypothetical protein